MYEKGGMTAERFLEFLQKHIFPNYKGYLIVLDNAKSHNNELIKNAITKSGNEYLINNINIELLIKITFPYCY
jgi:hypothetical protein